MADSDPYETLDVPRDATKAEIRRAYKRKAQHLHPEKEGGSHNAFLELRDAYTLLSDSGRREHYDRTGEKKPGDRGNNKVHSALANLFMGVIQNCPNIEQVDIIATARQVVTQEITQIAHKMSECQTRIAKFNKLRKRVTRRGKGVNVFVELIDQQIRNTQNGLEAMQEKMREMERLLDALRDYSCVPDMSQFQSWSTPITYATAS